MVSPIDSSSTDASVSVSVTSASGGTKVSDHEKAVATAEVTFINSKINELAIQWGVAPQDVQVGIVDPNAKTFNNINLQRKFVMEVNTIAGSAVDQTSAEAAIQQLYNLGSSL